MTILHVKSTDADTITKAITSYLQEKNINCRKLVSQGYDGAPNNITDYRLCIAIPYIEELVSNINKHFSEASVHAIYVHCSCHQLQLASIQAENSVLSVKRMFGTMVSLWSLFYYSPQKADSPELKVIKPSDTRWLSHERCVRAILKELPASIIPLQSIYNECVDAEAYGLALA